MKINHNNYNLNYYQLIIKIIFLILVTAPSITLANDNKIASVIEISGDAIALTEDGDERELEIFDNLFIEDEIFIGDDSSVTIQFNDNTTIILKELTSLNVKEFEDSEARAVFKLKLGKGEIIIESKTSPCLPSLPITLSPIETTTFPAFPVVRRKLSLIE